MEDDQNERRLKWKTTKMEDDQNGRRPKWKTTIMEDDQNGIQPKWKQRRIKLGYFQRVRVLHIFALQDFFTKCPFCHNGFFNKKGSLVSSLCEIFNKDSDCLRIQNFFSVISLVFKLKCDIELCSHSGDSISPSANDFRV